MNDKINKAICTLVTLTMLLAACQKQGGSPVVSSSLTIVNAMWTSDSLVTNFNAGSKIDTFRNYQAAFIQPNSYKEFTSYFGNIPLQLSPYKDSTHPVYNGSLNIAAGGIYSLFMAGSRSVPDFLFITDKLPVVTDTAYGIRFVNLLAGNKPVTIDIQGGDTLASQLPYKGIVDWRLLSTVYRNGRYPSYTINFRDANTSVILVKETIMPMNPTGVSINGKSVTHVLKGNTDSAAAKYRPAIIQVNNY